jgi:hypothetical protein
LIGRGLVRAGAAMIVSLCVLGLPRPTAGGSEREEAVRCPPEAYRAVLSNADLVVFELDDDSDPGILGVCERARPNRGEGLGQFTNIESVSLRGLTAAYSDTFCAVEPPDCKVAVRTSGRFSGSAPAAQFALPFVTQTAIAPDRAVAWIACRSRSGEVGSFMPRSPRCLRGDRIRHVYVASRSEMKRGFSQARPERLDHGPGIKARSLRIRKGRVYWTRSGRTRSARLP